MVSAFVAMGLIPVPGPDGETDMRVDRERAVRVRRWTVGDPQSQDFGPDGSRRIDLPIR
jgi:hypothetical protein